MVEILFDDIHQILKGFPQNIFHWVNLDMYSVNNQCDHVNNILRFLYYWEARYLLSYEGLEVMKFLKQSVIGYTALIRHFLSNRMNNEAIMLRFLQYDPSFVPS